MATNGSTATDQRDAFKSSYAAPVDRFRIGVIASVSAVIIFGCVAAVCLWKGGVCSLANRKLCYGGFASCGVALTFAVVAAVLGYKIHAASKPAQKPEELRDQDEPTPPPLLVEANPPAVPVAGNLPPPMSLDDKLNAGFVFRDVSRDVRKDEQQLEMSRHIIANRLDIASLVPAECLVDELNVSDEFIGAYLAQKPKTSLIVMGERACKAFVAYIINNRLELANLITHVEWIENPTTAFIDHYLKIKEHAFDLLTHMSDASRSAFVSRIIEREEHLRLLKPAMLPKGVTYSAEFMKKYLQAHKGNIELIRLLPESLRPLFVRHIVADEPKLYNLLWLEHLTVEFLTEDFMEKYLVGRKLYAPPTNPHSVEAVALSKLVDFIIQKKPEFVSCITHLGAIQTVPSPEVIQLCLSSPSVKLLHLDEMKAEVRKAFIDYINANKIWKKLTPDIPRYTTYADNITEESWVSHLTIDNEGLGDLLIKLNAQKYASPFADWLIANLAPADIVSRLLNSVPSGLTKALLERFNDLMVNEVNRQVARSWSTASLRVANHLPTEPEYTSSNPSVVKIFSETPWLFAEWAGEDSRYLQRALLDQFFEALSPEGKLTAVRVAKIQWDCKPALKKTYPNQADRPLLYKSFT